MKIHGFFASKNQIQIKMEHLNVRNCNGQYNSIGLAVPSRGLWFLTEFARRNYLYDGSSFRPLSGTMVLNKYRFMTSTICRTSFRPLSGIMVLNSPLYRWHNYAIENRVCGADFIFAVFSCFIMRMTSINSGIRHSYCSGAELLSPPPIELFLLYHFFIFSYTTRPRDISNSTHLFSSAI